MSNFENVLMGFLIFISFILLGLSTFKFASLYIGNGIRGATGPVGPVSNVLINGKTGPTGSTGPKGYNGGGAYGYPFSVIQVTYTPSLIISDLSWKFYYFTEIFQGSDILIILTQDPNFKVGQRCIFNGIAGNSGTFNIILSAGSYYNFTGISQLPTISFTPLLHYYITLTLIKSNLIAVDIKNGAR